jgi:hypothetical protein
MKKLTSLFLTATRRLTTTSLLTATALLTAFALLLSTATYSQSPNPLYQHLSPSANHIYSVRLGQIITKGELAGLLGSIPIKDPNAAKFLNIIKDPASGGVDLNHEILVAQTTATGNGADTLSFTQILLPLTDSAKFRLAFMATEHVHRVPGKGATMSHAKVGLAWNDRLLVATMISTEKPAPGTASAPGSAPAPGTAPTHKPAPGAHGSLSELALEKSLASLTGYPTNPLLADQRFLSGFATDEDMHAWAPKMDFSRFMSKFIKKMMAKDTAMRGKPLPDFANMDQTPHPPVLTTFNFENGRVMLRMTTYNAPDDAAVIQRVFDQPLNKDLLARIPAGSLLAFSAAHFNPAALPDFLEKYHTLHLLDSLLGKQGLSVKDLSAVFGGDLLFAAVGDTAALNDTTKKKVNTYFVATLGDPAKLMQLTAKLMASNASTDTAKAAKMKKLADKMMIRDNLLVISSSHEMAREYFDNTTRRPTDLLDGKKMQYAMIDLKAVSAFAAAALSDNPKAMIAARILEKLDKIEIGSSLTDGNTVVTFQIVTGDPSTNSLKTIVSLLH